MVIFKEEYFLDDSLKDISSQIFEKLVIMHSEEEFNLSLQEYCKILSKEILDNAQIKFLFRFNILD